MGIHDGKADKTDRTSHSPMQTKLQAKHTTHHGRITTQRIKRGSTHSSNYGTQQETTDRIQTRANHTINHQMMLIIREIGSKDQISTHRNRINTTKTNETQHKSEKKPPVTHLIKIFLITRGVRDDQGVYWSEIFHRGVGRRPRHDDKYILYRNQNG